ncbi:MAG: hypothetical protein OJJ21_12325 [Ferrovibrio sp.]|uniref:hypothetical protein n=1 Tax=Ferrovibrio sp. TaxID=1917215 RepID=UPI00261EA45A|nr:hypothetical protein [Ferrovibrio sp.]MCW0234377.1 hypothetical protein [Ferrovibrio sp.]
MSAPPGPYVDPGLDSWVRPFAEALIGQTVFHRWAGLVLLSLGPGQTEVGFTAQGDMLCTTARITKTIQNKAS